MALSKKGGSTPDPKGASLDQRPQCGIVMPISGGGGYSEPHWCEVKTIISDALDDAGFTASLVSDADDVGIIQKRIVQNLYENPIVVCDVSGKNPNVMFELGMRLAFDKPAIIVKDDRTAYSFDTAPIEHLEYPADLRFAKIVEFKRNLGDKVKATLERSRVDPKHTTFLKHFGTFAVAQLETKELPRDEYIIEELRELRRVVTQLGISSTRPASSLKSSRSQASLGSGIDREVGLNRVSNLIVRKIDALLAAGEQPSLRAVFEAVTSDPLWGRCRLPPSELERLIQTHLVLRNS